MTKSNLGTDAKTIALHYLNATTDGRNTPLIIAKTINQAKSLLNSGYTVEEVCATIDHVIQKGVKMYSIGYINAVIGTVLEEVKAEEFIRKAQIEKQLMVERERQKQGEVNVDVESTERNRRKAERISLQSGKRTQHYRDMFEGN